MARPSPGPIDGMDPIASVAIPGDRCLARVMRSCGSEEVAVADVAYRSEVVIERHAGGLRKAFWPAESKPVLW
jgi:hypothetical protein